MDPVEVWMTLAEHRDGMVFFGGDKRNMPTQVTLMMMTPKTWEQLGEPVDITMTIEARETVRG